MIIVSGIPFSGATLMLKILECGGLQIVNSTKVEDYTLEDNTKAISLSALDLKKIENKYKIIFMERNLEECFKCMKKKLGREPHRSAFEILLKDLKRKLQNKDAIFINYDHLINDPKEEIKKIKEVVLDFEKVEKNIGKLLIG